MSLIRDRICEEARGLNGLGVTKDKKGYVDLLGPKETYPMQEYFCMPGTSGCGLVIRGLWRRLGLIDRKVSPPYVFGRAITWLVSMARDRDAWLAAPKAAAPELPQPGDFVLVGGDKSRDGGVEHVFTVLSVERCPDGTVSLTSIDGGQRDDKGNQVILEKNRSWAPRDGSWWDVSSTGSDPGAGVRGGRRVMGWCDSEKIFTGIINI